MIDIVAEFISNPNAAMSTRDCVVRASAGAETASEHQVHTATVKAYKDLDQTLLVPEFDGWETVNIVCLQFTNDWMYYWVTSSRTSSTVGGAVEFNLTYNAVTSQLGLNGSYTASLMRSPYFCRTKGAAVLSGAMEGFSQRSLGSISGPSYMSGESVRIYYVQVTSSMRINADGTTEHDRYTRYAFFCAFGEQGQGVYNLTCLGFDDEGASVARTMPSLQTLISDPEEIGITASTITDISISDVCPFEYTYNSTYGYLLTFFSGSTTVSKPCTALGSYYGFVLEEQDRLPVPRSSTITLNLTEMQRTCGTVTLTDPSGSTFGTIPNAWFDDNGELELTVRAISDLGSITIRVETHGSIFSCPAGHLPYLGSSWLEYVAYSQSYDRMEMQNSIDTATRQAELSATSGAIDSAMSVAGSVLSGDLGGAISGVISGVKNYAVTMESNQINADSLRAQQDITEKRMQAQPGTAYSSSYGMSYCLNTIIRSECVQLSLPAGLTQEIYEGYAARYGLPCETINESFTLTAGYWQMLMSSQEGLDSGPRFDRLNSYLQNGFRVNGVI